MMPAKIVALPLLAALAVLPGCVSLTPKPPPELIRLTPAEMAPTGSAQTVSGGQAITVLVPTAASELGTLRVPVRDGASALSYLKAAQWADNPTRLFRDLLAETIRVRTGRPVLDVRDYHMAPGPRLSGRIGEYGLEAGGPAVVLVYDATLQKEGAPLTTRRFAARVPIPAATEAAVAPALDQAANQVAAQVADWVGR